MNPGSTAYLYSMKRTGALVILFCMMLHCAGSLGLLSHLYQQRHVIAYNLGIIAEIPIALCSSDYHSSKRLHITEPSSEDELPAAIFHFREVNLFQEQATDQPEPAFFLINQYRLPSVFWHDYASPASPIFHPPSFS